MNHKYSMNMYLDQKKIYQGREDHYVGMRDISLVSWYLISALVTLVVILV